MALLLLLRGLRLAVDVLLLLLDLNFFLVSSLLAALLWLLAAIASLPAACWHGLLLAAGGLAQAAAGVLRGCWAAVEGAKALGQLLALRGREALRQGVVGLLGSGQAALRQACEGAAIAGSLLAYLVNSAVNMGLLGAQSLVALLLALWDAVVSPTLRLAELLAACLAHVSSSAIALSILLWSPCQLACEMLASFAELLVGVFFVNVYGLGLLLAIIGVGAVVFNPGVLWVLTGHFHALPAYRRLQREAWRLYQVAVLMLGMALTSQAWRRMVDWSLQVTNWSRGGRTTNRDSERRGAAVPPPRPAALGRLMLAVAGQEEQPDVEQVPQARPALGRSSVAGQRLQPPREEPSTSRGKAPRREQLNVAAGDGAPDDDPWMLLKEQEERKKCVICQDQTKTVLLLPCRHLCLCQECTEVLLQQAIYQRNCPLCRQMILQTLNVYL